MKPSTPFTDPRLRAAGLLLALTFLTGVHSYAADDLRLIEAVRNGDIAGARALISERVAVDARAGDGTTALHWAAYHENVEALELLLRASANVNAVNDLGVTPLWVAASNGSVRAIAALVRAGADPNRAPATGGTPLMLVSRTGDAASVKLLLSRGADVNAKEGVNGQTALMWAVSEKRADIAGLLIAAGADIHARSRPSRQVVLLCCPTWAGDAEGTVEIDHGSLTPLLFAAVNGDVASATRLLDAGERVDDVAAVGATALVMAAHAGHRALVTLLLERNADPNTDGAGYTALHSAVLRGDPEMVKALIARRADLNARLTKGTYLKRFSRELAFDKFLIGATPFMLAARAGDIPLMRALATAGADMTVPLADGRTPLIVAAQGETTGMRTRGAAGSAETRVLETVKLLIEMGANLNARDAAGNTALHVAAARRPGFDKVIQLLAEHGAALEPANQKGETPLALALAPPAPIRGQSTTVQTIRWRADYAAWEENKGRTSTTDLLRALGARQ